MRYCPVYQQFCLFVKQLAVSAIGYPPGRSGSKLYLIFLFGGLMNGTSKNPECKNPARGQKSEYMMSALQ